MWIPRPPGAKSEPIVRCPPVSPITSFWFCSKILRNERVIRKAVNDLAQIPSYYRRRRKTGSYRRLHQKFMAFFTAELNITDNNCGLIKSLLGKIYRKYMSRD